MARTALRVDLTHRPRRLRRSAALRTLVRETRLDPASLIAPLFVRHGHGIREPIPSLPGQMWFSTDGLDREVDRLRGLSIAAILLFGVPETKSPDAREAYAETGIVQDAIRQLRRRHPSVVILTDVCLCAYTDHGHCGVVSDGRVDNDASLDLLARTAVSHAPSPGRFRGR